MARARWTEGDLEGGAETLQQDEASQERRGAPFQAAGMQGVSPDLEDSHRKAMEKGAERDWWRCTFVVPGD